MTTTPAATAKTLVDRKKLQGTLSMRKFDKSPAEIAKQMGIVAK